MMVHYYEIRNCGAWVPCGRPLQGTRFKASRVGREVTCLHCKAFLDGEIKDEQTDLDQ